MKTLKTLLAVAMCGLIFTQEGYSAQKSKADAERDARAAERDARAQKAKEERERQQKVAQEQAATSAVLKPLRALLNSPTDISQYEQPSDNVQQSIRDFFTASVTERVRRIDALKQRVEDLAKAAASAANAAVNPREPGTIISDGRVVAYRSDESKAKGVDYHKQQLAEVVENLKTLKANDPPFFSFMPEKQPEVGMIGRLSDLRVQQVVSSTEAIVERKWYTTTWVVKSINGRYGAGRVYQAPKSDTHSCWFWMTGVNTTAAADGSTVTPPQVFQVTGTKTYPTAIGGTKTLFVIEPVDVQQYLKKK